MIPNLRDPSFISALVYFDRAAQFLSFARAAEALGVTAPAVSHRIAALEQALGKRLFEREVRKVTLTHEGAELAKAARQALVDLQSTVGLITERHVLRVSIARYISATWLMPLLGEFEAMIPGLRVDLTHTQRMPDMRAADVAIVWTDYLPQSDLFEPKLLFDTACVPVIAPHLVDDRPFFESDIPPIHYENREPWRQWLHLMGEPTDFAERGEIIHDPQLVLDAAAHGRGVAIGFLPFVASLFESGKLVRAHGFSYPAEKGYWVVVADRESELSIQFEEWLFAEAEKLKIETD